MNMSNKTKFIINTSVEYFSANIPSTELDEQTAQILEFLENEEHTVIAAVHNKSDGKIKFHQRIPNAEVCLLFYKVPHVGSSTNSNANSSSSVGQQQTYAREPMLGILTLEGGLVKSIYNSVSRVFSPHAEARQTEYSPELSGLLENLHVSLGTTLGLPQSGIASVKDEIKFWKQKLAQKSGTRQEREMAQLCIAILERIELQVRSIDAAASGSIEEFLDHAHNNLDELWRLPYNYPQQRMSDLLDIIGNRLLDVCLTQLLAEDIWSLNSYHINNLMSQCIDTVDAWIQLCDSLTRLFWPNYVKHPWIGESHIPKRGLLFKERLTEIRNIKNLFKQIATLLNDAELHQMFQANSPFSDFNIFDTTTLGQNKWNKALQQFEQLLQPIDERIASALQAQLHHHLSNPRQVIFIFSKYETLIQRPTVLELLTIEREQFLQSLHILLQDLRKAMADTNLEPDTGHLSVICNECRWLKVVQYQIQEIEKVSHLISGREGFDKINKAVQEIKEETESLLRTNFEIWSGQCSTAVKSGELKLRDDQPVVKFEKEGRQLMRVTFNPKLVTFCQDVREFENLGYNVPLELRAAATHAAKYMCYARRLQQIATFHNTIGDRMIPCQRPIMLKNAMELSKLVQSETVAWNDEESVQRYVNMLQAAVSKLSADNTLLVGYHEQAKRTVIKLMNTDLFTQNQIWKDEMRHLRELVATLERQGYTNLDAFKLHWDHQLYKVLEYQYIIGLVDMNNKLPDIHIKLVFRQRQLCFVPPEEEIRDKYFSQLRRFIERPCSFRGLSEQSADLFKSMVELNRHHFGPLFQRAEQLFEKLESFKQIWLPWVALGCVDVEELCGIHLSQADDWDRNFRACKSFSQKIAKLQNSEESIDCVVINVLPLHTDIELISRRYWDALTNSLRTAILADVTVIQEFLQQSLQFLQNVPMDEASITESGMKYEKIMSELPKINETLELVKAKDTCLAGWCKERVSALAGILLQWEKLQPLLENHAVILQRQVDMIKTQAQSQIQNLRNEAEKFLMRWESTIAELEANEHATLDLFKERQAHWQQIQTRKQELLDECAKFNMEFPADVLAPFTEIAAKVEAQSQQWQVYDDFLTELQPILQEEWAIYRRRPYVLNEFISKWEGSVHASIDLSSKRIRQHVTQLQEALPLLQQLQTDALNERHWTRIFMLLKKSEIKPMHSILLSDILADTMALQNVANELANIVRSAASEQIVRQALMELDQWSVTAQLKLIKRNDAAGNEVSLIKDYQEVLNKIGDNQSLLQAAKNSAAFESFSDQAELWESRLNTLDTLLNSLSQSQRRWVYLEPVFGAGTLKHEEALFKRIDKDFRYVMREIQSDTRVISLLKINNITMIVSSLETQLARCQHNLMSYITDKRNSFPRFYFLGDDDLLELLGQAAKDADIIQKHIKKLFPGCHSLGMRQSSTGVYSIHAVHSIEGDILTLNQSVELSGAIELWLNKLVSTIQSTLKQQIFECYNEFPNNTDGRFNEHTLRKYPIQVLSTVRALHFTRQTEKAIMSMSLSKLQQNLNAEITQCALLKNQQQQDHKPGGSGGDSVDTAKVTLLRLKLSALLVDLVHYASIVGELLQHNVVHVSDWHWLCQLKFYFGGTTTTKSGGGGGVANGTDERQVYIRMVYAEFEYSYEFLGNPNKLVNTSLTHKCYLILTQAMHMGLGGNPFGPAGTGKTECVKALGAMLGRLVLVFNCDENVDTDSMGLILTGLARCGAWGCFDEFNRLQEATLSAISMLIQPIQTALKDKAEQVQIGERQIKLNQHCGIFVTLNPAGVDYGGRQKLPGNIQALFRPIVMQQPEPGEIARVMLFVEGFTAASEIAERIVELFDLCGKMLTAQRHYDWGLRELKTVLRGCGESLRQQQLDNGKGQTTNEPTNVSNITNDEMSIVVRCLRTSTMSKLAQHDVARFEMLLRNVFPEITIAKQPASALEAALSGGAFAALGLCANDKQIEKALQLHEQLQKRMGVVVVGPPGCGKSTIIALLRQALMTAGTTAGQQQRQIRVHTISPKSMSRIQLLGCLDPDTRQWLDGVLTNTAVLVNQEPAHVHSWIVCDGSIDPEWIEALNSVLDDNKLLTLPSGWRIQFGNNINFIFETDDVRHASPATISRMGIVNINHTDYPLMEIVSHRLAREEYADLLQSYIETQFEATAKWLEREFLNAVPAYSRATLLHALMIHLPGVQSLEEFIVAMLRALYGFVPVERHNELANMALQRANLYVPNPNHAELTYYNSQRAALAQYEQQMDTSQIGSTNFQLIQTAAMCAYLDMLSYLLAAPANTPFLLVGPSGAAKTLMLQHAVQEYAGYELVTINCSTQLTPAYVLHCLRQHCVTISGMRGREYKPKQTRIVLFMKNLDLCYLDTWGACEIMELLLQLVQRSGFYADNLEWITVNGLQICGSVTCGSNTSASLLKITPRYLAINQCVRVAYPTSTEMLHIVQCRLEPMLYGNTPNFKSTRNVNIQHLSECLMECFQKLQSTFTGQTHYQFTPKCIMRLLDALRYYPESDFNEALYAELLSLFKDRLISTEHVAQFESIMKQTMRKYYGKEKIYFVPRTTKCNSELQAMTHDEWLDEVQKQIAICNTESYYTEAPITEELLYYAAKMTRILGRAGSHLLMLAQPGGRHLDAAFIAATRQQAKVQSIQGGAAYALQDFYNDLKMAMQTAALDNQCTCLLIEHCWLSYVPDIMKPLEALLEGSEILELFGDELESVASGLKHAAQLEGYQETLGAYFMKRARENLHLFIVLNPKSAEVTQYFNRYPALHRSMDILYVRAAANETYASLPKQYIEWLSENSTTTRGKVPVSSYFGDAVEELLEEQVPKRFYQLIRSYYYIYSNAALDIDNRLSKLQLGVDKLAAAHALVGTLKTNAAAQEEALAEKRKLANDALEMISATMRNANEQKSSMLELKKQTQMSSEQLKVRQREIQQELSEVEPILAEASTAVGQIKSEALSEIRSLRAPPEAVRDILEGVLRLMGIRDTSWNSMKTFLAKRGVKEDIRSLDPARINPENCEAVEKLLVAKADSFEMKNAKRASAAAAPLAAWVKASVRYSKVIQSIKPLEREQNELQKNLDAAEGEMQQLATGLDDVDKRVKQLSAKLNSYTQEAAVLELKLEEARGTLKSAEVLVEKLSTEYQTWSLQLDEYKSTHKTLDTKSLMIALSLNYYSHLTLDKRIAAFKHLNSQLQISKDFDIRKALLTEQEQIIWESLGLARDAQIIENAALLRELLALPYGSCPLPLVIDPTQTALNWLMSYLQMSGKAYELTTQNNDRLAYTLELAVRFGKVLVVQDCAQIRPPLMQMLAGHVYMKYNKRQVEVANKLVDLHENFQLVLCTKTDKLCIAPELSGYLTCLHFTVTAVGLCDQLMSKAIVLKNKALEEKRIELLKQEGELLKQRMELQDKLLEELSNAQGDILKNTQLLQTLNEVKESSSHIDKSLKESSRVKDTLLAEYKQMSDLCARAAHFYTGMTLSYELSALIYIELFLHVLQVPTTLNAGNAVAPNDSKIYAALVRATYEYLARATPRASHLSLAMFVCKQAYSERISKTEWELFVTNFMSSADASSITNLGRLPDCMSKEARLKLNLLMTQVPELQEQLQLDKDHVWRGFIEQETDDVLPAIKQPFQRVLIAQIFRPDLLITQLRHTAADMLGIVPESIVQPSVEQLAEESSSERPILMITQAEYDPATEIRCVAIKKLGREKYQELAIGKGMEVRVLASIRQAAEQGKWICIKNVHLVPAWLTQLEREFGFMQKSSEFRLWLICESTHGFSESVVYKMLKVLYEPPSGLKAKVRRMTQNYVAMDMRTGGQRDAKLLKMRIVMFIAIAVLQERRQYIPQGWSKYYEFGESDLKAALALLTWLDSMLSGGRCDWLLVQRLCEYVAFGGRISNKRDLQVLEYYLQQFCNADVLSTRWTPLNLSVSIPTTTQLQDYYNAFTKLPDVDEPATYGLSEQAQQNRALLHSKAIIMELRGAYFKRKLMPSEESTNNTQTSKLTQQIRPILSLWRKLAGNCTVMQTANELQDGDGIPTTADAKITPWQLFVQSELRLAARLYEEVHRTLAQLHNWLKESTTGAHFDADALQALAENQLPTSWLKLWTGGAQTAVDYLKGLIGRAQAAEERYRHESHLEFIANINFVQVFNCGNFLACLKLFQAQKSKISSQHLSLECSHQGSIMPNDDNEAGVANFVVKLAPLKLDGVDGCVKSKEFQIFYKIRENNENIETKTKKLTNKNVTRTSILPVYANSSRAQLICQLEMPLNGLNSNSENVLLAGAALIVEDY